MKIQCFVLKKRTVTGISPTAISLSGETCELQRSVGMPPIYKEHDLAFQGSADPEHLCWWEFCFPWSGSCICNSPLWVLTFKTILSSWSSTEIALKAELMFGILPLFCPRAVDMPIPSFFL